MLITVKDAHCWLTSVWFGHAFDFFWSYPCNNSISTLFYTTSRAPVNGPRVQTRRRPLIPPHGHRQVAADSLIRHSPTDRQGACGSSLSVLATNALVNSTNTCRWNGPELPIHLRLLPLRGSPRPDRSRDVARAADTVTRSRSGLTAGAQATATRTYG